MKILVTGAAGFIGSNLAYKLAQRGDEVVGLDNFNDYYDPAKKRANQRRLASLPNVTMVEADLRDRPAMLALFERGFDAVAHLAGMGGVRNSIQHPALYMEVNTNGTQNLLDAAREASGVGNFVFASTSSVYGATERIPFVESDPCDRPLQPYAASKRAAELLGYTYHYLFGINFTAVRFFTVYGPYNRPDMMAYLVPKSITSGQEIPLYEGDMRRDWTFVDDITDGITLALERPLGYEIINLGRGEPTRLHDFIAALEALAGKAAHLVKTPKPAADIYYTYADISKARRLLGFDPQVSVAEGVKRLWAWFSAEQALPQRR